MLELTARGEKLAAFCSDYNLTYDDLLRMAASAGTCAGICTNVGCDFVCEEVATGKGGDRCAKCSTRTITSAAVIAGLI